MSLSEKVSSIVRWPTAEPMKALMVSGLVTD